MRTKRAQTLFGKRRFHALKVRTRPYSVFLPLLHVRCERMAAQVPSDPNMDVDSAASGGCSVLLQFVSKRHALPLPLRVLCFHTKVHNILLILLDYRHGRVGPLIFISNFYGCKISEDFNSLPLLRMTAQAYRLGC